MSNHDVVKKLLDGFKGIPRDAWRHNDPTFCQDANGEFPESGFCVGHRVAVVLGHIRMCENTGRLFVSYVDGANELARLFGFPPPASRDGRFGPVGFHHLLVKHGAPMDLFGPVWAKDPYEVLRDAAKDHLGYDHEAQDVDIEDLIPDEIFDETPEENPVDNQPEPVLA